MSPRATRRAAERQADKQLRKDNPAPAAASSNPAVPPVAQEPAIVLPAFDFTDEEDDALTLHNPLAEKTLAAMAAGVYTLGTRVFRDEFPDEEDPIVRAALIKVKTMQEYRRDLTNLALQERRLRNHIEKDLAKLEELQKRRITKRKNQVEGCQKLLAREPDTFKPSDIGFDFSTDELQAYLDQSANRFRLYATRPDFDLFLSAFRKEQNQAVAA
jgi:hypothetical protein